MTNDDELRVDGLALRRATAADAPAIQAVIEADPATWAVLEGAPPRPDEAIHLLAEHPPGVTHDRTYVYIADDTCVIDLVEGFPDARTWYLGLVLLTPGARNRGLGTRLLEQLCAHVRRRGGRALRLAVVSTNTGARRLYDRLGFAFLVRKQRPSPAGVQELDVLERMLDA